MKKVIFNLITLSLTLSFIPAVTNYSLAQTSKIQGWGIVFSANKTQKQAEDELKRAKNLGFPSSLYLCNSMYRGIIIFAERKSGLANLINVKQNLRSDAYLVDMSNWCIQSRRKIIQSEPIKYKKATIFEPPSNIRSTPNGQIICSVRSRTTINILGQNGQWLYTDFCGKRGVIHQNQVKFL